MKALRTSVFICLIWLLLVGAGFAVIIKHQNTGGATGRITSAWPVHAGISLAPGHPTLVMFVHPKCPCSRASLEELSRVLAKAGGKVSVHVLFFQPHEEEPDWVHTQTWGAAAMMPGVSVTADFEGQQARLFGAETSGHVFVYDPRGQLLFQGGITGSRGHAGDNAGASTIQALLAGQGGTTRQTPVYGCSILTPCNTSNRIP